MVKAKRKRTKRIAKVLGTELAADQNAEREGGHLSRNQSECYCTRAVRLRVLRTLLLLATRNEHFQFCITFIYYCDYSDLIAISTTPMAEENAFDGWNDRKTAYHCADGVEVRVKRQETVMFMRKE